MNAGPKARAGLACLVILLAVTVSANASTRETPKLSLELESGPVWQSRNVVQIPNDETGTRFSLADVIGNGSWPSARLYATWNISPRHGLRAMLAPLNITAMAIPPTPINFAGASFLTGEPIEATYKFNSWRLSYRYRFHDSKRWTWWIGFTAKIRDAKIRLEQGDIGAEKTDVGFVPLLHVAGMWRFQARWSLNLDVDALAGGPGRAEDVSIKLAYNINDRWSLAGGYRTIEGGADVDEVYNFAWLHYAVISVGAAL